MLYFIYRVLKKIKLKFKIILFKLLYKERFNVGKNLIFRSRFNLVLIGGKLTLGDNVFMNNDCSLNCLGEIVIGNDCLFGEGVKIYDHNHVFNKPDMLVREQGFSIGKVEIGNNCWIGSNTIILNNVTIGDDVVIGANCLIYKNIPSRVIVKAKCENTITMINK